MSQFARLLGIAMVALTATGCAPHIDDLVAYTNDVKQNTKPSIEPYPEFEQNRCSSMTHKDFAVRLSARKPAGRLWLHR